MGYCEVCGNDIIKGASSCRYCGEKQDVSISSKKFSHQVVNIELGRPIVEVALNRLDNALERARLDEIKVLTLIHGYGSSGKGGVIGKEVRKMLDYMYSRGEISAYIYGENFGKRHGPSREQVRRFPQLSKDRNYNKANQGITLVFL